MSAVVYSRVVGGIFLVFAIAHAYRLASPFTIQFGSLVVPYAASWAGVVFAVTMGILGLRARA